MIYVLLLLLEIIALYLLSRHVVRSVFHFFYQVTRRRNLGMYIFAILFLPGTFIHEISHFLAALFLLVPVGEFELIPKFKEGGGGVDLGSVAIAKTDKQLSTLEETEAKTILATIYNKILQRQQRDARLDHPRFNVPDYFAGRVRSINDNIGNF